MKEFIEKLIGMLEEASHWEESIFDEEGYCNDDSEEVIYLHKAIEIVNKLSDEYNNDFCEWKDGAIGIFHIKTSCGHSIDVNYGYEFCPYCGKKIKVAPYQSKGE